MRKIAISCFLLLMLPFAGRAFAQDEAKAHTESGTAEAAKTPEPPAHYYHLDFVVQEVGENGKPVNSRTYTCTVSTTHNERDSIRISSRVPIAIGAMSNGVPEFQFQDISVNFDVNAVREIGGKLAMSLGADVASMGPSAHLGGPNGIVQPVKHQNTWRTPVLIPIGKETVVFTSDDLDTKGGMQVVLTATLLH